MDNQLKWLEIFQTKLANSRRHSFFSTLSKIDADPSKDPLDQTHVNGQTDRQLYIVDAYVYMLAIKIGKQIKTHTQHVAVFKVLMAFG